MGLFQSRFEIKVAVSPKTQYRKVEGQTEVLNLWLRLPLLEAVLQKEWYVPETIYERHSDFFHLLAEVIFRSQWRETHVPSGYAPKQYICPDEFKLAAALDAKVQAILSAYVKIRDPNIDFGTIVEVWAPDLSPIIMLWDGTELQTVVENIIPEAFTAPPLPIMYYRDRGVVSRGAVRPRLGHKDTKFAWLTPLDLESKDPKCYSHRLVVTQDSTTFTIYVGDCTNPRIEADIEHFEKVIFNPETRFHPLDANSIYVDLTDPELRGH